MKKFMKSLERKVYDYVFSSSGKPKLHMQIAFKLLIRLKMIDVEYRYHKQALTRKPSRYDYSTKELKEFKREHFISMVTRRCKYKGKRCDGGWAYLKHSNCAYHNEMSNYNYCCKDCHEQIDAMYQEMWDEYNSGRY